MNYERQSTAAYTVGMTMRIWLEKNGNSYTIEVPAVDRAVLFDGHRVSGDVVLDIGPIRRANEIATGGDIVELLRILQSILPAQLSISLQTEQLDVLAICGLIVIA